MISSAATLPFFLFTLPAGVLADLADRRGLLRVINGWLACSAGLLAFCAFLGALSREVILAGVFLLGIGFAFQTGRLGLDPGDRRQKPGSVRHSTRWNSDEPGRYHWSGRWRFADPIGWGKRRFRDERGGIHPRARCGKHLETQKRSA